VRRTRLIADAALRAERAQKFAKQGEGNVF